MRSKVSDSFPITVNGIPLTEESETKQRASVSSGKRSASYCARMNEASFWETWVATVLSRAGLFTVHWPSLVDGGTEHLDSWDLGVAHKNPFDYRKVEVKAFNIPFNSAENIRRPLFLSSQVAWDRKGLGAENHTGNHTLREWLIVSKITGMVVWVPKGSPVVTHVPQHDMSRDERFLGVTVDGKYVRSLDRFVEEVRR
jgi:hypothetical protein